MAKHAHEGVGAGRCQVIEGWIGENSYLPATDTEQEANHVGLLLLLEFFHVLEGTHLKRVTVR